MNKNKGHLPGKNHLPLFGVEPIYVCVIIAVTAAGILFCKFKIILYVCFSMIKTILLIVGVLLIAMGAELWFSAVFRAKIDDGITNNHLVTDGVYALVRNPIYSGKLSFAEWKAGGNVKIGFGGKGYDSNGYSPFSFGNCRRK